MKLHCIIIFLLISLIVSAQKNVPNKAKKLLNLGIQAAKINDHQTAIQLFEKAIKKHKNYKKAIQYLALSYEKSGDIDLAIEEYNQLQKLNPDKEKNIILTKANLLYNNGRYKNALNEILHIDTTTLKPVAKALLNSIKTANELIKNPVDFNPEIMSNSINSSSLEYLPSFTADEETIVFTRRKNDFTADEDFYISFLKDSLWTEAENFKEINTPSNEGAICISADGKTIVFAGDEDMNGYGNFDLWIVQKDGDEWGLLKNLGPNINTSYWESQPSLSANGKTLYFASKRPNAYGGIDIYASELIDEEWTKAIALDSTINTKGKEQSPFIHHDNRTLYFSSDGHPGLGKEDLFFSKRNEDGWTKPENLGYPINTHKTEATLVVSTNGERAYFASDKGDEKNGLDIYSFNLPQEKQPEKLTYFKGIIKDAISKKPILTNVELINLVDTIEITSTKSDSLNGTFLITLKAGESYMCNVNKSGYLFYSDHFTATTNLEGKPYIKEIFLQPIIEVAKVNTVSDPPKPIVLNNIFFESGKAILLKKSTLELNRLVDLLNENELLKIKINGHTDNVGSEADNLQLSKKRAKAVVDFLVNAGINNSRLKYEGFGESRPLSEENTEIAKAFNRRTEFEIVK